MTDPSHLVVVFCEGPSDSLVVRALVPRVLKELADWFEPSQLEFCGLEAGTEYRAWSTLGKLTGEPKRFRYGFDDASGWGPESTSAWKALHAAERLVDAPSIGVVLLRDGDSSRGKPRLGQDRRAQIEVAVDAFIKTPVATRVHIALGVCDPKVECWVLNAFEPSLPAVAKLRSEMGFNPSTDAHRLVGGPEGKAPAKQLLAQLTNSPSDWVDVLEGASVEALARRGEQTGLRQFLQLARLNLGLLVAPSVGPCDWCTSEEIGPTRE